MRLDCGLVAADVALDGIVEQQLGEVAHRHHQVKQAGNVVDFGLLVLLVHLTHLLFQLLNLLDGRGLF